MSMLKQSHGAEDEYNFIIEGCIPLGPGIQSETINRMRCEILSLRKRLLWFKEGLEQIASGRHERVYDRAFLIELAENTLRASEKK
jgi:hypothetical protein